MRTSKSTRRHAQEIINNLHLMQEAYYHLNNLSISNANFSNYLRSQFIDKQSSTDQEKYQVRHPSKNSDELIRVFFPHSKINLYQTLHFGKLRLCTRSYAEKKLVDDSNIIFLLNDVEYPGKIRTIFTIDDGKPYLLVAYLRDLMPFICTLDRNESFSYPHILHTSTSKWNYVPIEMKDFIEKCVFFLSPTGTTYFIRFPTLEHSS